MREISDKEKLQMLEKEFEEFLYIISHDFAAPIRHINGFVSIIQQDKQSELDPQTISYLNNIAKSNDHLDDMLKGLLKLSRINTRPGDRLSLSLKSLLEAAWHHNLRNLVPDDAQLNVEELPSYVGDEDQLRQAFTAILLNSIQYRNPTGDLEVNVRYRLDDLMHVIYIEDNGIGIHPKMTERVFKPFTRAVSASDFPGLGLGLTLAKKVIEHHDGDIELKVGENGGTCVLIRLPMTNETENHSSNATTT